MRACGPLVYNAQDLSFLQAESIILGVVCVSGPLRIRLGVNTDPIEYRYSYEWLFRLMAEEGVYQAQVGTFFELYHLEDDYFHRLRQTAEDAGIAIASMFTAHRELGGFFLGDPAWEKVARRSYERLIEVGALLGAKHVGSNPGAVLRDRMDTKARGIACYLRHMKELMDYAGTLGVGCLTIEPMSCLAEPPTLPEEIRSMAEELAAHHAAHPNSARIGYCADTSHGLPDKDESVRYDHLCLFKATLPWLVEFHIKNTDARFGSTFGFGPGERARGIVDLHAVRDLLYQEAGQLPSKEITAFLEIGGPKLGRDYSDSQLEAQLRASLRHLKEVFEPGDDHATDTQTGE
jgi:sugar phosphate isomerase/epimerase